MALFGLIPNHTIFGKLLTGRKIDKRAIANAIDDVKDTVHAYASGGYKGAANTIFGGNAKKYGIKNSPLFDPMDTANFDNFFKKTDNKAVQNNSGHVYKGAFDNRPNASGLTHNLEPNIIEKYWYVIVIILYLIIKKR